MPRFVVIDTETTGFIPKTHSVMEVAALVFENGKVTQEFESLLSLPTGAEVPIAVQILTAIKSGDLEGKPKFSEVQPTLKKMCDGDETIVVGQNLPFDIGMLRGEGFDLSEHAWIDTSMLASLVFPELPSYSLGYLSEALKLNHTPKHRALGDVRATYELLQACTERLSELSEKEMKALQEIASRGPKGYQLFFASLSGGAKKSWKVEVPSEAKPVTKLTPLSFPAPTVGVIACAEEPLSESTIGRVLKGMQGGTWFVVKNVDTVLRRWKIPAEMQVLHEPSSMIDPEKRDSFLSQKAYTEDEVMLAMKLVLYTAETKHELPIHGGEYQVFQAKLACAETSKEWQKKAKKAASAATLLSHRELFRITRESPKLLPDGTHVIIDDSSMLEDTMTQSEGWMCSVPTLRAAAAGNKSLSQCTDTIELWAEKTRNDQSIRYLAPFDLQSKESCLLSELLDDVLKNEWPEVVMTALTHLRKILDASNLEARFAWIETMKDGSKMVQSVPDTVSHLLAERIAMRTPLTLLLPKNGVAFSDAFLARDTKIAEEKGFFETAAVTLTFPIGLPIDQLVQHAKGKSVLLVGSKRIIEDIFVRHAESSEARGLALVCQGFSGGSGRMQAEFLEAKGDALMVLTPWMYEGMDLEPGVLDSLVLHTLPFDHPQHAIIGRRAERYQNGFAGYSLPRLLNRLFRLMRTFVSHAKQESVFIVADDRIRSKGYGKDVKMYMESLVGSEPKKESVKKDSKEQLSLL
ncbi:MAG: exonuclease domain-containing protein [Candidatus Peribacteraceae bacterium]